MKLKEIFSKNEVSKPRRCEYNSVEECPYNSASECNFDKAHCHLTNHKRRSKTNKKSQLPIVILALCGILVYILTTIVSLENTYKFTYSEYIYAVVSGIAISVVTGSILAIVIDLPSRLKDYELSFVNALSSNNYLKSLDENRLTNLRNDITEQLHKTKAPCMARGLIKIDQRVCELLRQPYYSRYRHTVACEKSDDPDFIIKEHTIEYKLINPYSVNQAAVEYIKFTNLVLVKEGQTDHPITDLSILCSIDNKPALDLAGRIKFNSDNITNEFYNKKIFISDKEGNEGNKGVRVEFNDYIEVKMRYKIAVPKNDLCFTKRLQHPAKNFRLDYSCDDNDRKLYGQIFGTEIKQSDISIKYAKNSISLETFDWLLPGNGAIVVM